MAGPDDLRIFSKLSDSVKSWSFPSGLPLCSKCSKSEKMPSAAAVVAACWRSRTPGGLHPFRDRSSRPVFLCVIPSCPLAHPQGLAQCCFYHSTSNGGLRSRGASSCCRGASARGWLSSRPPSAPEPNLKEFSEKHGVPKSLLK